MTIHYADQTYNLTYDILDSSTRDRRLKGEDSLTLKFNLASFIDFPVGSWVEYPENSGLIYTLEKPENFKKRGTEYYEYTLILESAYAKLRKYKFREKTSDKFTKLKFSLTAKPQEHLQILIDNLNERDVDKDWKVGKVVDAVEKTISYSHNNCDDALNMIADAFETEWEIDGKTVNICKVEYNTGKDGEPDPLPLSYGRGNGFKPGVGRSNYSDSNPIEVLFVQGGERNINYNVYHSKELLLPKEQRLIYEDREYISSADGLSIQRYNKDIVFNNEGSLDCSEIYPKRVGSISSVETVDEKNCFYDIIDSSIPENLDFTKYIIDGETMTIIFQSGMLAGREFEVKYIHDTKDGKLVRKFEIKPQEYDGIMMPNETFKPKATVGDVEGDKYAVFNSMLPDEYICDNATQSGGSWDMYREAARYLYENENPQFTFTGDLDGIWAKRRWYDKTNDVGDVELGIRSKIRVGGYILFRDDQFNTEGTKIRIVGIKESINNPHAPTIELSNATASTSILSDLAKIETNEVVVDNKHKEALQFTKRRYRDAKETISMLEESLLDNFTNSINPVAVQTMSMLVGDEALQFQFVENMPAPVIDGEPEPTLPPVNRHQVTYDKETKILTSPAGVIQHLSLGINSVSSEHKASEYKFWNLPDLPPQTLTPATKYWLYAKVTQSCTTLTPESVYHGEFLLSDESIIMKGVEFYYLLVGILNSEYDGARSYTSLYGFTEVLPGRITTDRIVSGDGKTYFDLKSGEIGGRIVFKSGSGGLENVDGWNESQTAITKAQATADSAVTSAGSANNTIAKLSDDNIISAIEKPALKKEYDVILVEYSINLAQANSFVVDIETIDSYTAKYNALKSLIGTNLNSLTTDWEVNGSTLRTTFKNYYTERTKLLNSIAVKAKDNAILAAAGDATTKANSAKIDARNELAHELGYVDYDNMVANAQAGTTIIKGGYINTNLIIFDRLETEDSSVVIDKDGAKIGDIKVLADGDIFIGNENTVKTENGIVLTKRTLPSVSVLQGGGGGISVNVTTAIRKNAETFDLAGTLKITNANATFSMIAKITIACSFSSVFNGGTLNLSLIGSTGRSEYLGSIELMGTFHNNTIHINSKDIKRTYSNLPKGTYILQATATYVGDVRPPNFKVTVSGAKMSFSSTIKRTEMGRNGYMTVWNTENYEHTAWSGNYLIKTFKGVANFFGSFNFSGNFKHTGGKFDVPGVLCAGTVTKLATKKTWWGAKLWYVEKYNNIDGQYKITHNLGHTDYFMPPPTPIKSSSWNWVKLHGIILDKQPDYVIVGLFDSGMDSRSVAYDFDFMIVGRN